VGGPPEGPGRRGGVRAVVCLLGVVGPARGPPPPPHYTIANTAATVLTSLSIQSSPTIDSMISGHFRGM
jgi:hypothetical protein